MSWDNHERGREREKYAFVSWSTSAPHNFFTHHPIDFILFPFDSSSIAPSLGPLPCKLARETRRIRSMWRPLARYSRNQQETIPSDNLWVSVKSSLTFISDNGKCVKCGWVRVTSKREKRQPSSRQERKEGRTTKLRPSSEREVTFEIWGMLSDYCVFQFVLLPHFLPLRSWIHQQLEKKTKKSEASNGRRDAFQMVVTLTSLSSSARQQQQKRWGD